MITAEADVLPGRETLLRVAAGAVAKKVLSELGITVQLIPFQLVR